LDATLPDLCRNQIVQLDCMAKQIAQLDAKSKPQLIAIAAPASFPCANRV
jgi:hypothetical protein